MAALLPSDRYLAQLLGLTDEEYTWFKAEARLRARQGPQPSVSAIVITWTIVGAILLAISVGAVIIAQFFKPRPKKPPELRVNQEGGQTIGGKQSFTPRYGFNSTQDIATLGLTVPVVYSLRETIDEITYGGVRVSASLLWSQIYSLGGSQMLRAIFLIGNGPVDSVDNKNFASGDNTLTSYDFGDLTANQTGSRMSVYGRYANNLTRRITIDDHIFGKSASEDEGNIANFNSEASVFDLRLGNSIVKHFCSTQKPGNQTTFGVYGFCGNDFMMKPNPTFEPEVNAQLKAEGKGARVRCIKDKIKDAQRNKARAVYSSRSGIISQELDTIGGTTTYKLFSSSDKDTGFGKTDEYIDKGDLTPNSSWNITKRINDIGAPISSAIRSKLLTRLSVTVVTVQLNRNLNITWTGPTVIGEGGSTGRSKAYIAIRYSFNTANLTDEDIQALKTTVFEIRFRKNLDDNEPEEYVEVEQEHRILVDQPINYEEEALTPNEIDALPFFGSTRNINSSFGIPTYQFDKSTDTWTEPTTSYSFTYVDWFSIKRGYFEDCEDIAAAIAGRQATWDDSLIVGELYKIGTGLAVCTSRTNTNFVSEVDTTSGADGEPQSVEVNFKTVRTGTVDTYTQENLEIDARTWDENKRRNLATTGGHIMRCAIASISTTRACKAVEIGIKSALSINLSGITNFNTTRSYHDIDDRACRDYSGDYLRKGELLYVDIFRSQIVSTQIERYSFFYISYRIAGTTGTFTQLTNVYGIRSATNQPIFNSIQLNMPDIKQWEFQIEPITGYEIRNHITSNLYLLDSVSYANTHQLLNEVNEIKVLFSGVQIRKNADSFNIPIGRRKDSKGGLNYPETDSKFDNGDRSYIDTWGKVAESFVYEEVTSSASSPEHEITYINEIVPNVSVPNYDNLALIGINIYSSVEWQQFQQFSCYVTGGKTCRRLRDNLTPGPTHLFPDILLDLLTNTTYGRGDLITDDLIDFESFKASADWCYDRKYFFDGAITDEINIRQWAADTAATHLLRFVEVNGKFSLQPDLPLTVVEIKGLFTAGNIVEDTFELEYLDPEDRERIRMSVRYREERASTNYDNPGLFPTVREVLVKEPENEDKDKLESVDVSNYCTNKNHAIDAAKYMMRKRRISTHIVRFTITHESLNMSFGAGDYIKVAMDETEYDEFNNGGVTPEGALVSTQALDDGTYPILAWNRNDETDLTKTTLTVSDSGKTATPTNIIFTVLNQVTQVRTYQVSSIAPTEQGSWRVEAVHMPVTAEGVLELADGFDTPDNWIIEE